MQAKGYGNGAWLGLENDEYFAGNCRGEARIHFTDDLVNENGWIWGCHGALQKLIKS